MSEQTDLSALQRKAGTGRAQPEGSGMTPAKAFRLAVSKAAQVELGLAIRVTSIKEERLTHGQLLEALDADALLLMLEGPLGGVGVAVADIDVISALIEVQTLGQVVAAPAIKRPPTRTDSAMCEAVLDQILQRFEGYLAEGSAEDWASGFRCDKPIGNIRLLGLAMADVPYRMFHLQFDMADGAKQGVLQIVLPAEGGRVDKAGADAATGWAHMLEKNVGDSSAEITAVLHRFQISLAEVQALKVDALISVPKAAIIEISMEGSDGVVVGDARLGQQNGHRALRLKGATTGLPSSIEQFAGSPQLDPMAANPTGGIGVGSTEAAGSPASMPLDLPVDIGGEPGAMSLTPDLAMPDMAGETQGEGLALDLPEGLPDLPMMPMADVPLEDPAVLPMAAMPMDFEIS